MRFLFSILVLASVVFVLCVPYFVGHGLALESSRWIWTGIICGVIAAALIFFATRVGARAFPRRSHG
jgi:hypothetical protein